MNANNRNGSAMLTKVVWSAIGVVAFLILGGAGFFATNSWADLKGAVAQNTQGRELRSERIALLEGRMSSLESANSTTLTDLKKSFEKLEDWKEQVRNDLAELKAAAKVRP